MVPASEMSQKVAITRKEKVSRIAESSRLTFLALGEVGNGSTTQVQERY